MFRNIVEILADETVGDNVRMRDHFVSRWNTKSVCVSTAGAQNWPSPCLWMGGIDRDQVMAKLDDQMLHEERIRIPIVDTVAPTTSSSETDSLAVHWSPPT